MNLITNVAAITILIPTVLINFRLKQFADTRTGIIQTYFQSRKLSTLFLRLISIVNIVYSILSLLLSTSNIICGLTKVNFETMFLLIDQGLNNVFFLIAMTMLTFLLYHRTDKIIQLPLGRTSRMKYGVIKYHVLASILTCTIPPCIQILIVGWKNKDVYLHYIITSTMQIFYMIITGVSMWSLLKSSITVRQIVKERYKHFHLRWIHLNGQFLYSMLISLTWLTILTPDVVRVIKPSKSVINEYVQVTTKLFFFILPIFYAVNDKHFRCHLNDKLHYKNKIQPLSTQVIMRKSQGRTKSYYNDKLLSSAPRNCATFTPIALNSANVQSPVSSSVADEPCQDDDNISLFDQLDMEDLPIKLMVSSVFRGKYTASVHVTQEDVANHWRRKTRVQRTTEQTHHLNVIEQNPLPGHFMVTPRNSFATTAVTAGNWEWKHT